MDNIDKDREQHLEILSQKLESLTKMLNATKRLKITGEGEEKNVEREIELFSSLYEQRANVVIKIKKMDALLLSTGDIKKLCEDKAFAKARGAIIDDIKKVAKDLVALDKIHLNTSKKFTAFLKGGLKTIRNGRNINNAYLDAADITGYHFDRAN